MTAHITTNTLKSICPKAARLAIRGAPIAAILAIIVVPMF